MKKQIIKLIVLVAFFTISISCNDFLDVNDSPNKLSTATPDQILPAAQAEMLVIASETNTLGNYMVYNWAIPNGYANFAPRAHIKYDITNTTLEEYLWEHTYILVLPNLSFIENFEQGGLNYNAYKAIAKILRAFQYQQLVDLYGNIPYSDANSRTETIYPTYDDAATIYKDLINKLTKAAITATTLPADFENPGSQDVIFKGDMQKWAQFANTIKLRFLIRISGTGQDAYITSEIAKINANGAGYVTDNVTGNPDYIDERGKSNPFYSAYGKVPGATYNAASYGETVASDFAIDYLVTTNDPRMERIYSEVKNGGGFKGAPQSETLPTSGFGRNNLSHPGPGLLIDSEQDQPLMLHAEALLLQAEAMVKGYIPGGDAAAKLKYEEAITSSFKFLGVPNATTAATTYLAQNLPNVAWNSSTDKLEAIATQKWVALNGVSGAELWVETTRTGFPANLPISTANINKGRPVGLLYPFLELERNAKNVPAQTKEDAFTRIPFWKN